MSTWTPGMVLMYLILTRQKVALLMIALGMDTTEKSVLEGLDAQDP